MFLNGNAIATLVPEVFLDFSPHERAVREPRSGEHESRSGEKEKPQVTLDLNLTFHADANNQKGQIQ